MLAKEGSNWYDCRTTADLILDEASSIRLKIKKTGEKLTVFENISLDAFPKRPNKTTRVRLILTFTSEAYSNGACAGSWIWRIFSRHQVLLLKKKLK